MLQVYGQAWRQWLSLANMAKLGGYVAKLGGHETKLGACGQAPRIGSSLAAIARLGD